ncbi:MAG: 4Fe-4S binding protein [Actinomycetota bacterium]|nr:4Fe-4S binding protein [Actinomycetota bacterium]
MPRPIVDSDECTGCGICVDVCPNDVLELVDDISSPTNEDACDGCGLCAEECPMEAIVIEED